MDIGKSLAAIFVLHCAGFLPLAGAATFFVDSVLDAQDAMAGDGLCHTASNTCTLRAAITEANALAGADVITLPAGIYTTTLNGTNENLNADGDFDITSEIAINGADAATTYVQAATTEVAGLERVFHLRSAGTVILSDLTVRYGKSSANDFDALNRGGGVLIDAGTVIANFNRVRIMNNNSGRIGGGLAISGAENSVTTLNNCIVERNQAGPWGMGSSGGGINLNVLSGTLNVNESMVVSNGVYTNTGASASGGGISSIGTLSITDSTIANNTLRTFDIGISFGGGLAVTAGTATIQGSAIRNNESGFGQNNRGFAGGIDNQGATVNISNSTVSGNVSNYSHGGMRSRSSSVATITKISNSTVSNNAATAEGGGVINLAVGAAAATTTIVDSTVVGNVVSGAGGVGAGVENLSSSTGPAVVNVINSTISGNIASTGAGSRNKGSAAIISFNYATVAGNMATADGGGILQAPDGGTVKLKNSIVADNTAATGPDISGNVISHGYNHVENISGAMISPIAGDVSGSDPQLGALGISGGVTMTHRPALSSPVVDAIPDGTSDCGTAIGTSQNGVARPQETGCEKGSVELSEFIFRDGFDGI